MKKSTALLLIACILFCISAFAAEGDRVIARRDEEGFDETIISVSALDGALIMLSGKNNFYRYSPTDGSIAKFVWETDIYNQMT